MPFNSFTLDNAKVLPSFKNIYHSILIVVDDNIKFSCTNSSFPSNKMHKCSFNDSIASSASNTV